MEEDGTSVSFIRPITEIFSDSFVWIYDTVNAAKTVHVHKESFKEQSHFLELIATILKKLSKMNVDNGQEKLKSAAEILTGKIMVGRQLALKCSNRNKIYLMLSCRRIVKDLERSTREIGRALSGIPLPCFEGTLSVVQDEIRDLCKNMLAVEYQVTRAEEEVLNKIDLAIQEGKVNPSSASVLLNNIAEIVQISTDQPSVLMKELEEFKNEIENAELRDDIIEAVWMDQVVVLLGQADLPSSPHQRAEKYLKKRNSLGRKLLEPLQSFYCPISGDIMEDPVETPSGQSYEKAAIVKWLGDGNNFCPLTKTPLNTMVLRSNRNLRRLIEEWKDRNTMITIASMKERIQSTVVEEVLECLGQLKDICLERELHQEWLIMEDYLPVLIGLLRDKTQQVRKDALALLCILAKDHDGHKEKIAGIDKAIEFIVHALGRKVDESKFALQLLLELSMHDQVRSSLGKAQGCILLVTTMCSSIDEQAINNAKQLLHNLSSIDQNVIEMAKANYFGPLLHLLSSGSEETRVKMAKTLAELELADHKRIFLCKEGAHRPLLELLALENLDIKTIAIKALQNLASNPQTGLQIIKEGLAAQILELLYIPKLTNFRKEIATLFMHLANASAHPEAQHIRPSILESEDDIFKFFSLISFTEPDVQLIILLSFGAICDSPSGLRIRTALRQIPATKVLIRLCEDDNLSIRSNAVRLFNSLTKDDEDKTFLDHVNKPCVDTLLRIVATSNETEERAAVLGILSSLPRDNNELTQWMIDEGALHLIFTCLSSEDSNHAFLKRHLIENATAALCRFTLKTNQEWQKKVAEAGFFPLLVGLLVSGTSITKRNVCISLKQLSESSYILSNNTTTKKMGIFGFCCFAQSKMGCSIHSGMCSVESTFCLVEADAIEVLVQVLLGEQECETCEASLDALATLIEGELLQRGTKVLKEAKGIEAIIKLLSCSSSPGLQEKALNVVERMFRLIDVQEGYGKSAILPLVDIAQRGSISMKSLAAKVLAHLNVIHHQSAYF